MKTLIIIFILLLPVSANAFDFKDNKVYSLSNPQKWDNWDKGLFGSFSVLMTIDCLQTRDSLHKYGKEKYGLHKHFNEDTVPIVFIGCTYVTHKIADHLKSFDIPFFNWNIHIPTRKIFLTTLNIIDFKIVKDNRQLGLKLNLRM